MGIASPGPLVAPDAPQTRRYFSPKGNPVNDMVTRGWQNGSLVVNVDGSLDHEGGGDFPDMQAFHALNGDEIFVDDDGTEWLKRHCRLVEVYEDFDPWAIEGPVIPAWPAHIADAAEKCCSLQDVGRLFKEAQDRCPRYINDTQKIVLQRFIYDPIEAECSGLEALIAAYRADNPDVTKLDEPEEEEDAAV